MHIGKICADGIFVSFPLVTKDGKSRLKIAPFQMDAILKLDLKNKKQTNNITFFRIKLSKLYKKDTILHNDNYFPYIRQNKNKQWIHFGPLLCARFKSAQEMQHMLNEIAWWAFIQTR